MSDALKTQVLIAGSGPIGLTAAIELARHCHCMPHRRSASRTAAVCQSRWRATADARGVPHRLLPVVAGQGDGRIDVATFELAASVAISAAHGRMEVYLIAASGADVAATELPVVFDSEGGFAKAYAPAGPSAYVVRPDGYLGLAVRGVDADLLVSHLRSTFH